MSPRLRPRRDFVLVAVGSGYQYGAIYVLDEGDGETIYRAESRPGGEVALWSDNPAFDSRHRVSREWFDRACVGIVVAEVSVGDPKLLTHAAGPTGRPLALEAVH